MGEPFMRGIVRSVCSFVEADAVAPFEAHLHVANVRLSLAQRGHQPTSAEHLVGARDHLVDEHDGARCAARGMVWIL